MKVAARLVARSARSGGLPRFFDKEVDMQAQFIQRLLHCDQQVFCCLGGLIFSEQLVDQIGLLPQPQEPLAEQHVGVF